MKNKVCYILGSGGSLLKLTEEEKEYINNSECVLAFNKYVIFDHLVGVVPTHYLLGDITPKANVMFDETLKKYITIHGKPARFILNKKYKRTLREYSKRSYQVIKNICGESFSRELFKEIKKKAIFIDRHDWLEGGSWAKSFKDKIFHYRGSLSGAINICSILHPGYDIKLLGVDLDDHAYFFQEEIYKNQEKWGIFLKRLTPESSQHETIVSYDGKGGIQDMFPRIVKYLSMTDNSLYCCNPESFLVKQELVPFAPVMDEFQST